MSMLPYAAATKDIKSPEKENVNPSQGIDLLSEFKKKQEFSNFDVSKDVIKELVSDWADEIQKTEERRKIRYITVDTEKERQEKNLDADEFLIPVRVVHSGINREQAKYAQYLTQSSRSVIVSCNEDGAVDTTMLEKDFTKKCRYNAWEIPLLKYIDGTTTHAWDFVEVLFDKDKPGHFYIEHCGHENIFFPRDTKDFQNSPYILRTIEYTAGDLIKFTERLGWNKEQVAKLLGSAVNDKQNKSSIKSSSTFKVEKFFFRGEDDFIYIGWSAHSICDGWLREPKPLYLGKVEKGVNKLTGQAEFVKLYETAYPIEAFPYAISENGLLVELEGRVDMDESKQEAASSLLSSFCTSYRRSAEPYFSVDGVNTGSSIEEAISTVKLRSGQLIKVPLKQFQLTPPNIGMLSAINTLLGQAQMESGDVNYAVQSNKSTRKTAAEINLAQQESQLLSGVQVTLLSIALRNVYTRCWDIYVTRVLAGLIKVPQQVTQLLSQYTYTVKPAGDTDVIERQQKIALMQQSWEVYKNTPAAKVFLINLTKLLFPEEAQQYIEAFNVDDAKDTFITGIITTLKGLLIDPATQQVRTGFEQFAPMLQQMEQQAMQLIQSNEIAHSPSDENNDSTLSIPNTEQKLIEQGQQ